MDRNLIQRAQQYRQSAMPTLLRLSWSQTALQQLAKQLNDSQQHKLPWANLSVRQCVWNTNKLQMISVLLSQYW